MQNGPFISRCLGASDPANRIGDMGNLKMNMTKCAILASVCALTLFAMAQENRLTPEQLPNPNDGVGAVTKHLTDLRGYRYMEFFLVGSVPVDGQIKGTCYNTTTQNTPPGGRDSAPAALVQKLDPAALAKQYGVKAVVINPPRQWLLDWVDVPMGAVRDFDGIKAPWVAVMNMPKGEWKPYTPATIERRTKFGFAKGQTIYLLDDPDGNTWIMKSFTQAVQPTNTYDNLSSLGQRIKTPAGWKARTKVLDQELVLIPETGVARILRDDLDNVYDVTGPGYSSFKP
jgi:hypothetical protein